MAGQAWKYSGELDERDLAFLLNCASEAAYLLTFTCLHFSKSGKTTHP